MALAAGDGWLEKGANLIVFGPPGAGKSHLGAGLGLALVENGWRVLFTRTTDLVQRLQVARRDLALEAAIAKLDKYHLLILDDLAYVHKNQAETSVLFELIAARYERRRMLITANQPFGEWGQSFPRSRHDPRRHRPPRPPRHHLRDERRKLPAKGGNQKGPGSSSSGGARDNQIGILIDAPRQSNPTSQKSACIIDAPRQSSLRRDRKSPS